MSLKQKRIEFEPKMKFIQKMFISVLKDTLCLDCCPRKDVKLWAPLMCIFLIIKGGATNILLNNQVQTPKYFWKAVCDPTEKESVLFYAENPVGIVDRKRRRGCNGAEQTQSKGVIECTSISMAKREFAVPNFNANNCVPSTTGLKDLTSILTGFVR